MIPRHSMDMSGMDDGPSTSGMGDMKMYFHGSIGGDVLWFASWLPSSVGATVGACIALFVLAMFERWLTALRRACDVSWNRGQIGLVVPRSSGSLGLPRTPETDDSRPLASSSASFRQSDSASTSHRHSSANEKDLDIPSPTPVEPPARPAVRAYTGVRWSRPWRVGVDVPRGCIQALQTLLHYLLMLVVMTFNLWYLLAVVLGSGVGEMLFGRFGAVVGDH